MNALSLNQNTSFVTQMLLLITKELVPFLTVYVAGIVYFVVIFTRTERDFITDKADFEFLSAPFRGFYAIWNLGMGSMEYSFKTYLGVNTYLIGTLL